MEYLTDRLKSRILAEVGGAARVFLFLDYDGTLCRIMPDPGAARLNAGMRKIIEALRKNQKFLLGIITGRSLEEIRSLMGIKNIVYAGNHGLELRGPGFYYLHANAKRHNAFVRKAAVALRSLGKSFPGAFLEDKGVTLTFHYRLMDSKRVRELKSALVARISPWLDSGQIVLGRGKKTFEIRPAVNWSKGSAVRWILLHENPDSLPIYIGDDKTDETAFKALKDRGITIRVGNTRSSHARYFMKDPAEVESFLAEAAGLQIKNGGKP